MSRKTVFIIDNDIKNIDKIKSKFNNSSFKVVGESMDGEEALRKIKVIGNIDFLIFIRFRCVCKTINSIFSH